MVFAAVIVFQISFPSEGNFRKEGLCEWRFSVAGESKTRKRGGSERLKTVLQKLATALEQN